MCAVMKRNMVRVFVFSLQLLLVIVEIGETARERDLVVLADALETEDQLIAELEDRDIRPKEIEERQQLNISVNNGGSIDGLLDDVNVQMCRESNIWFVWDNQTKSCRCGDDLGGVVYCDTVTKELSVLDCNCLTVQYTKQSQMLPVVGSCLFNCENSSQFDFVYHGAPSDCASLNRQGTLCGQCLDGYTVPAYSYEFKCIRCDSQLENWGLYIVFAFLPLTVFIVIILVFRIDVLSPKLNMFVFTAQILSVPYLLRIILYILSQSNTMFLSIVVRLVLAIYGIWNLDFLRVNMLPDVCINVIPLHILVLDYLIAIYPMLLMAVAYIFFELLNSGFWPVMYMSKPFHYFFARCRRHWGIQNTFMDAFVTFFFLSTTKLLSVSCDLLIGVPVYTSDGDLHSLRLYYDPSIEYFGREHLPYALLAIGILIVFIVFPTSLLLFYQCKPYHNCLKKFQTGGTIFDGFVNTFQIKYYKDGNNGTWDCRWFAGFFVFIKSLAYVVYVVFLSQVAYPHIVVLSLLGASVIIIVEPYKEEYKVFNMISANVFLFLGLIFAVFMTNNASYLLQKALSDHYISAILLSLVPLVYIIVVVLHHLIRRFRGQKGGDGLTSSLPHRLLHSDQYRDSFGYIAAFSNSSEQ